MQRGLGGSPHERLHQEHYQKNTFARGLLFPIPDSRFPIPDSRFPIPYSLQSNI
ncbi:hypothetical protein [Moorena producens]|uniref:hypothetical protein n=1 Tax=Moorena producens TaxID=1155739 RepID=UPI003C7376A8